MLSALGESADLLKELGEIFSKNGFEISLVGGPVRDAVLGKLVKDLDLTTNAKPEEIQKCLKGWADSIWDVGIKFGTVGAKVKDYVFEITTYRTEQYEDTSRKPSVEFGKTLEEDLARRDFTINAMALRLPNFELVDIYNGLTDLNNKILRTPLDAQISFSEDPLRMLRAARFMSKLDLKPQADLVEAMKTLADRLKIVSMERINDEFNKLLLTDKPRPGIELLVETGVAEHFLPELPALKLEIDEHHHHKDVYQHSLTVLDQVIDLENKHQPQIEADLILRIAALLHDIGKPKTRKFEGEGRVSFHHHEVVGARLAKKRLEKLRYSNEIIEQVCLLIELHLRFHGYGDGKWTDSAVRRYVRDAEEQLIRLHKLTRADCTTRNEAKAETLRNAYNDLEQRIVELSKQEELKSMRPELDGAEIMKVLNIKPGPEVGKAYQFLLDLRLDKGILGLEKATEELKTWWAKNS
ncbi:MAG: CCA tRNA nucleotidyltransferase [Actinobacteria bacterium]|nr:CCA tRNA nucleotidyltransferase [Actinomycetota bacterium]